MPDPVITPALEKALKKGLGVCSDKLPSLEYLKQLAKANPSIQDAVDELEIKHAALEQICRAGLLQQIRSELPPSQE
jgi:hypothetical protein